MPEAADCLKSQCQSQLELTLALGHLGLGCCERLMEINGQSARAFLAQAGTDDPPRLRSNATGLMVETGRTLMDHWASTLACCTDYQRQILNSLAKK